MPKRTRLQGGADVTAHSYGTKIYTPNTLYSFMRYNAVMGSER